MDGQSEWLQALQSVGVLEIPEVTSEDGRADAASSAGRPKFPAIAALTRERPSEGRVMRGLDSVGMGRKLVVREESATPVGPHYALS